MLKTRNLLAVIVVFISLSLYLLFKLSTLNLWLNIIKSLPGTSLDKDIGRDIFDLIQSRGFKYEQHFIETPDGFILQTVRIINPWVKNQTQYKPVLAIPGFLCSGTIFICNNYGHLDEYGNYLEFDEHNQPINGSIHDTNTIGFTLAAKGYDVWLANYRASIYSANHTRQSPDVKEYWKFSLDEIINIDLPMTIDYILKKTGHSSLSSIGYSQGSIVILGLMSTNDHYAKLMQPFISLAPTWGLKETKFPFTLGRYFKQFYRSFTGQIGFRDMTSFHTIMSHICSNRFLKPPCRSLYATFQYRLKNNWRDDRIPTYMYNAPNGASAWNAYQLFELLDSEHLSHWDYGPEENQRKYGQSKAPIYNVSDINYGQIALFYLEHDTINPKINNIKLKNILKPGLVVDDYLVQDKDLDHMSFVWGKHAGKYFNKRILELLSRFN